MAYVLVKIYRDIKQILGGKHDFIDLSCGTFSQNASFTDSFFFPILMISRLDFSPNWGLTLSQNSQEKPCRGHISQQNVIKFYSCIDHITSHSS